MISRAPATNAAIWSGEKVSNMDIKFSMFSDSLVFIASAPILCSLATGFFFLAQFKQTLKLLFTHLVKSCINAVPVAANERTFTILV